MRGKDREKGRVNERKRVLERGEQQREREREGEEGRDRRGRKGVKERGRTRVKEGKEGKGSDRGKRWNVEGK